MHNPGIALRRVIDQTFREIGCRPSVYAPHELPEQVDRILLRHRLQNLEQAEILREVADALGLDQDDDPELLIARAGTLRRTADDLPHTKDGHPITGLTRVYKGSQAYTAACTLAHGWTALPDDPALEPVPIGECTLVPDPLQ